MILLFSIQISSLLNKMINLKTFKVILVYFFQLSSYCGFRFLNFWSNIRLLLSFEFLL